MVMGGEEREKGGRKERERVSLITGVSTTVHTHTHTLGYSLSTLCCCRCSCSSFPPLFFSLLGSLALA